METHSVVLTIIKNLLKIDERNIDNEKDLIELGMGSMKSIQLIVELESTFSIPFDENDLIFDKFNTINKIVDMVDKTIAKNVSL